MDNFYSSLGKIDLHVHSKFSDGACSLEEVAKIAETKGLIAVAITDHYSEFCDLPKRMAKRHLPEYLSGLEGFNFLKGVEAEVLEDGTVSISKEASRLFDVVTGGLHIVRGVSFFRDSEPILNRSEYVEAVRVALIRAMESRTLDIIAHVTKLPESLLPESSRLLTDDWVRSVVDAASDHGVAVELSGYWKMPDERFVTECLKQGAKLALGSDAHRPQAIGEISYGVEILKRLEIGRDSIFLPRNMHTLTM